MLNNELSQLKCCFVGFVVAHAYHTLHPLPFFPPHPAKFLFVLSSFFFSRNVQKNLLALDLFCGKSFLCFENTHTHTHTNNNIQILTTISANPQGANFLCDPCGKAFTSFACVAENEQHNTVASNIDYLLETMSEISFGVFVIDDDNVLFCLFHFGILFRLFFIVLFVLFIFCLLCLFVCFVLFCFVLSHIIQMFKHRLPSWRAGVQHGNAAQRRSRGIYPVVVVQGVWRERETDRQTDRGRDRYKERSKRE